jgi:hypothetical protein
LPRYPPDATRVVIDIPGIHEAVQLGRTVDLANRDEVVAAKPADLALDPALLVCAADPGLAAERLQAEGGRDRGPPISLDPVPTGPEDLGDRALRLS